MKKISTLVVSLLLLISAVVVLPSTVLAQSTRDGVCEGVGIAGSGCDGGDVEINGLVADVINILSIVVGIVAVIMIIIAGFRYITSGGDSTKVGNAKNTILYAIVGLVVVALAQFIVRFVLDRVTT